MSKITVVSILLWILVFGYLGHRVSQLSPCYDTAVAWQLRTKVADQMDALMNSNSEDTETFSEYAKLLQKIDSIADTQSEACLNP